MNEERALLIVDDEPNILRALKRLLRRDGYKITIAVGAAEGLKCLEGNEFGVILSDQRMPEMNGTEFFAQVKKTHPRSMRIILSGYTDLKSITDAINQGSIYKFFTKPWDDDQLRANIKGAFVLYELEDKNKQLADELQKANQELEKKVETEKRYATINLKLLQVSQDILQFIPMAVLAVDASGMLVSVNQSAINLLGDQMLALGQFADDVLPDDILDLMDDADGEPFKQMIEIHSKKYLLSSLPLQGEFAGEGTILAFETIHQL